MWENQSFTLCTLNGRGGGVFVLCLNMINGKNHGLMATWDGCSLFSQETL